MEDKRNDIMVITVFTTTWKHSTTEANMASANFLFIYFFSEITNLPKGPFKKKETPNFAAAKNVFYSSLS